MPSSPAAPLPPVDLVVRVGVNDASAALRSFDALGRSGRAAILDLLPADWTFDGRRVLDFGCGPGKVLRHVLEEGRRARLEACDIHAPSVDWVRRHLSPPVQPFVNGESPPLPRPARSYDLVWALSVFTHLSDNAADWLVELHRVLDDGGLLIVSTLGRAHWESAETDPWDEQRLGMAVVGHGNDWAAGGPTVYLSPWWFREHWGRLFEILDLREGRAPGEHTLALLRRRPVTVTKAEVEAPAPGDARELAGLQAQVALLRRDVQRLRERHRTQLAELETSLSWRLTAPLRGGAAAARSARAWAARRARRG